MRSRTGISLDHRFCFEGRDVRRDAILILNRSIINYTPKELIIQPVKKGAAILNLNVSMPPAAPPRALRELSEGPPGGQRGTPLGTPFVGQFTKDITISSYRARSLLSDLGG